MLPFKHSETLEHGSRIRRRYFLCSCFSSHVQFLKEPWTCRHDWRQPIEPATLADAIAVIRNMIPRLLQQRDDRAEAIQLKVLGL